MNPFDVNYVFNAPAPDDIGPYAAAFLVIFLLGTIISNFMYFYGKYRFKDNLLTYTLINRASRNGAIAFSLGFAFFLCRLVRLPPFNARLFLDIALILLIFYIVRGIGYMIRTYPQAKAEWENTKNPTSKTGRTGSLLIKPATNSPKITKPVSTISLTKGAAADAGGETRVPELNAGTSINVPTATTVVTERQGLSERGLKRRERKRSKR